MNKLNRFLWMLIAMTAIMIMAAGIDKGIKYIEEKKWDSEREVFFEEARADIAKMQTTIESLSEDREALITYMEENGLNYTEEDFEQDESGMMPVEEFPEMEFEENGVSEDTVSADSISGNTVSENTISGNTASENTVSGNTVSGNTVSGNTVSGNTVSGNTVSGNTVSGNTVSGNTVSGNTVSGNMVSDNRGFSNDISGNSPGKTVPCASYEDTVNINHRDKEVIARNEIDFSDKKIVCLGDSITAAANLENMENYEQMSYPYQLCQILGAKEVVNLGIGGSSIGRYWNDAFVDRYRDIPEDADIIIVMGGTNDGFCASERELGSIQTREANTFAGDLNELLSKLKEDYPEAVIVLATPLSNVLHDMLRKERDYLMPQSAFVKIMNLLADEYEIPVIDLYYSNFLNSHDAAVIYNFMPDGVHGNESGYRMLAEHMAAELIQILSKEEETDGNEA